jgi:Na+/H+-dicarboxylate symporter
VPDIFATTLNVTGDMVAAVAVSRQLPRESRTHS